MTLTELRKLAEAATPPVDVDWLDELFADQWNPKVEEYLRSLSPERIIAMLDVIEAAHPCVLQGFRHTDAFDTYIAARKRLEEL